MQKYKDVQVIAQETIEFLRSFVRVGLSAKEIKSAAEDFMRKKGVDAFWYHNIGAFVFIGQQTTLSVSGRQYQPSGVRVQSNDLVTVDLAPEIGGFRGDFARSFIVENGSVTGAENSNLLEMVQGIAAEVKLHDQFKSFVNPQTTFEQAYIKMNSLIQDFGYENLDFKKNLGHSIPKHGNSFIWLEMGNQTKFKDIDLFTFEPHIKKRDGKYGFKHEDIYYFDKEKLKVL